MHKIVILDGFTTCEGDQSFFACLKQLGEVVYYDATENKKEKVIERIGDSDIVLTNKVVISKEIMEACQKINYIGVLATGYNVVDLQQASKQNITVTNIPDYSTDSVAQHTFALLLECCNHAGSHSQAVKQARWIHSSNFCFWDYPIKELSGKTLGIVGLGNIGYSVSKIAAAFNMKILAVNPSHRKKEDIFTYVSLEELLEKSDVISLHCPLNDANKEMINMQSIAKMKDGVILINTARGGLINENDLAEGLQSGKIAYAALDVVTQEPMNRENVLYQLDNCIITPHIAWASYEARKRLVQIAYDNLKGYLNGKLIHVVNN